MFTKKTYIYELKQIVGNLAGKWTGQIRFLVGGRLPGHSEAENLAGSTGKA